jgi:hypothetical protein
VVDPVCDESCTVALAFPPGGHGSASNMVAL